jgi:hypothetical protein
MPTLKLLDREMKKPPNLLAAVTGSGHGLYY